MSNKQSKKLKEIEKAFSKSKKNPSPSKMNESHTAYVR